MAAGGLRGYVRGNPGIVGFPGDFGDDELDDEVNEAASLLP
jgi:hypothetical protein